MAATVLRHIVRFDMDNALPADASVNVWHTTVPDGTAPGVAATAVQTALIGFYTAVNPGSTQSLSSYFSSIMSGTWSIKTYDLADSKPRTPILDSTPTPFTPGTNALPTEVALVLSFRRTPASGVNPRRTRGRLYIGPFSAVTTVADQATGRPAATANSIIPTLKAAAAAFLAASTASSAWSWAVWSPTNGSAVDVQQGWVDNAWDTQRRRGIAATTRLAF